MGCQRLPKPDKHLQASKTAKAAQASVLDKSAVGVLGIRFARVLS